jgi:hypothetical protein
VADDSMALLETLRKASARGDVDVLREGVRILAQAIIEAEVSELTGVAKGERDPERRLTHRNGYRDRRSGHPGRDDRSRRPAGAGRLLLPLPARAAPAGRAGPARGCPGSVRVGCVDKPSRRPRPGPRHRRDQQERGQPDVCGAPHRSTLARDRWVPPRSGRRVPWQR